VRKPRRLSNEQLAPWVWEAKNLTPTPPSLERKGEKEPESEAPLPLGEGLGRGSSAPILINWPQLFGNTNPVEIEVGTGKGLFLLHAATTRPGTNFLGIEIVRKYQLYATTRYAIRNLPNVKTACADAKVLLRDFVSPGSVAAVHVYFPDPWWKKRHKKRRVFTPEFAADAAHVLMPGGRLFVASDVEEYFILMTAILRAMPAFAERPAEAEQAAPQTEAGYATNFERKALAQGTAVWRAVYERTAEAVTIAPDPADAEA
jgi:tRNA (guanine-N7-)-methyltransferase